jgi:antitoxin component of MazEF toxin-antitoxin module
MSSDRLKVKLKKTGNSLSVTIPSQILKALGWKKGDELELEVDTRAGVVVLKR